MERNEIKRGCIIMAVVLFIGMVIGAVVYSEVANAVIQAIGGVFATTNFTVFVFVALAASEDDEEEDDEE